MTCKNLISNEEVQEEVKCVNTYRLTLPINFLMFRHFNVHSSQHTYIIIVPHQNFLPDINIIQSVCLL